MPEVLTQKRVEQIVRETKRQEVADLKVTGLVLRGNVRGATWCIRSDKGKRTTKTPIGSPPELSLADARTIAAAGVVRLKQGLELDPRWIEAQRLAVGAQEEAAERLPAPRVRPKTWLYEDAVIAYVAALTKGKAHKEATLRSYRQKLTHPALRAGMYGRAVIDIKRRDAAKIIAEVAVERSTTAEDMVGTLQRFWDWMSADTQQEASGLTENVMLGLRRPDRPRDRPKGAHIKNPTMASLGRIVAACRAGVMHPSTARAIEVAILTAQRRETVASAWISEVDLTANPPVWKIGGDRMKMGADHWIPLSIRAAEIFKEAVQDAKAEGSIFAFPGARPARKGGPVTHVHPDTLSHYMSYVAEGPGITPHRVRIAFRSSVGLEREEAALVLDHLEGRSANVTDKHYLKDPQLEKKGGYLTKWEAALLPHVDEAVDTIDPDAVLAEIRKRKREVAVGKRKLNREKIRERVQAAMARDADEKTAADEDRRIADEALEALRNGTIDMEEVRRRLRLG